MISNRTEFNNKAEYGPMTPEQRALPQIESEKEVRLLDLVQTSPIDFQKIWTTKALEGILSGLTL